MPRRRLNRREALQAGAALAAVGLVRPSSAAACGAFERSLVDVDADGWTTTAALRAPRRFDLIGLRWNRGGRLEAQVRARRQSGSWTAWAPLHPAGDHAPDGGRSPSGTEPAFTGAADVFQLRVKGHATGVRARFVRALPDAAAARRRARARPRARASQTGAPPIFARGDWGGDGCAPRASASYGEVQLAFVHHTVTANDYAPEESAGIVLGICRYHRDHNKWNDVGYNFLVDRYGQIFEGRAGGAELAVIGAQAQGYNRLSTGIACLGDFSAAAPDAPGMEALARLIAWKLSLHGVPVEGEIVVESGGGDSNRYPNGAPVRLQRISGHRDGDKTTCPGQALYDQLPALRARAAALAGPVSGLSLHAAAHSVKYPSPTVLSGVLRFSDGVASEGATVEIQHAADGVTFSGVTSVPVGPGGRWSARAALSASGKVRARFGGDASHPPLESAPISVTVQPSIALKVDRTRVPSGAAIAVSGTYAPAPWPEKAQLVFERQVGRRWVVVQRKQINVRKGAFATRVRPKRPGLHRVWIVTPGASARKQVRAVRGTGGADA
jgi:hypothetical protein